MTDLLYSSPGHDIDDELMYGSGNAQLPIGNDGTVASSNKDNAATHLSGTTTSGQAPVGAANAEDDASTASIKSGVIGYRQQDTRLTSEPANTGSGVESSTDPAASSAAPRSHDYPTEMGSRVDPNLSKPRDDQPMAAGQTGTYGSDPATMSAHNPQTISQNPSNTTNPSAVGVAVTSPEKRGLSGGKTTAEPFDGPKGTSQPLHGPKGTEEPFAGPKGTSEPLMEDGKHQNKVGGVMSAIGLGHKDKADKHDTAHQKEASHSGVATSPTTGDHAKARTEEEEHKEKKGILGALGLGSHKKHHEDKHEHPASESSKTTHDSRVAPATAATSQPSRTTGAATTGPTSLTGATTGPPSATPASALADRSAESHTGRDTAIGGAAVPGVGAVGGHEFSKHQAEREEEDRITKEKRPEKVDKHLRKAAEHEEKAHEKAMSHDEKGAEKEHKQVEKEELKHEKEVRIAIANEAAKKEKEHQKALHKAEKKHEKEEHAAEKEHEKAAKKAEKEHEKDEMAAERDHQKALEAEAKREREHRTVVATKEEARREDKHQQVHESEGVKHHKEAVFDETASDQGEKKHHGLLGLFHRRKDSKGNDVGDDHAHHDKAAKEELKREKEHKIAIAKEAERKEKEHEKAMAKHGKEHEKVHKSPAVKHEKEAAYQEPGSEHKEKKHHGILGLFHRRKDSKGNDIEHDENDRTGVKAVKDVGPTSVATMVEHENGKHREENKLHKDPPAGSGYTGDSATPAYADYPVKEDNHPGAKTVTGGFTAPDPEHDQNKYVGVAGGRPAGVGAHEDGRHHEQRGVARDHPHGVGYRGDSATPAYTDYPVREKDRLGAQPIVGAQPVPGRQPVAVAPAVAGAQSGVGAQPGTGVQSGLGSQSGLGPQTATGAQSIPAEQPIAGGYTTLDPAFGSNKPVEPASSTPVGTAASVMDRPRGVYDIVTVPVTSDDPSQETGEVRITAPDGSRSTVIPGAFPEDKI